MDGWIKLHRSLLEWEWFTDSNTLHVFIYLLLKANIKEVKYKGFMVPVGSLIVSVREVGEVLGLSYKVVRTAFERLTKGEQISTQATNKFTIVTICNYENYQLCENPIGRTKGAQNVNKRRTKGAQRAHIEEEEKNNKFIIQDNKLLEGENQNLPILPTNKGEERLEKIKQELLKAEGVFRMQVKQFAGVYPQEMLEAFTRYWTEPNPSGTKMRFQMQKTWSLAGRLSTWAKNEAKFSQRKTGWSQPGKNDSKSTLEALVGNL